MKPRPTLVVLALAGVLLGAVAAVVHVRVLNDPGGSSPQSLLPILVVAAALCVVGLTLRRHPTVAWLATVAALTIATVDLASMARASRSSMDAEAWRWLSVALCVGAVFATGAAVAYAADPRRRIGPWVMILGAIAIAAVVGAGAWALARASAVFADPAGTELFPLGTLSLVTRAFLVSVVGFVALGLVGDGRPAARRARRRVAVRFPAPVTARQRAAYVRAWVEAFADELAPGRTRARRAVLSERSRLARDLHAEVVPAVRRALAEAERDGSAERLSTALRDVLLEVDALVQSQHAIQLEIGGLVPALEWLAERAEDRSGVQVTIDVLDGTPAGPRPTRGDTEGGERPPSEVAAAAFRIAGLALENVVRHAPGAHVRIDAIVRRDRVDLGISDDGPGISVEAARAAESAGRRGLVDMDAEAAACGGALAVESAAAGSGTSIRFNWPA
ncbi:MAG: hypothetical protein OEV61_02630 [Chloroflexota bacterium]|nr:hypothetical protein [Chloroflexota bacterium]